MKKYAEIYLPLAVCFATLFFYRPTISYGYVNWDDAIHAANPLLASWSEWIWRDRLLTPHIGYPIALPTALWALIEASAITGKAAAAHALNGFVHAFNCLLLTSMLRRFAPLGVSVTLGLAFGLHPLVVEPVAWTTGLKDLLVVTGFLLCALGVDLAHRGKTGGHVFLAGAFVAFGSKPTVVVLGPLVLAAWWLWKRHPSETDGCPRWLLAAGGVLTVLSVAYTAVVSSTHHSFGGFGEDLPLAGRVVAAAHLQISHLVFPLGLRTHYLYEPPGIDAFVVVGGVFVALVIGIAWTAKHRPVACFGLLVALVTYLPYSGIASQARFTADSYMYAPLAGLALCVAGLVGASTRASRVAPFLLGVYAVFCAVISLTEMPDWSQGGARLWEEALTVHPDNAFYKMKLGQARFEQKDYAGALEAFSTADTAQFGRNLPFPTRWPLALCYLDRVDECEAAFVEGIRRMRSPPGPVGATWEADREFLETNYELFRERYGRAVHPALAAP